MRAPFAPEIVVPLWIIGVGLVATLAPQPGVVTGVLLLLAGVVVVPVVITRLLWTERTRSDR